MYKQRIKVTDKFLIHNFKYVIEANMVLLPIFEYISPSYYNFNNEGLKYDAYVLKDNVVVVMGRRPIGNIKASYELCRRYGQLAREIEFKSKQEKLEILIDIMLVELLGANYENEEGV